MVQAFSNLSIHISGSMHPEASICLVCPLETEVGNGKLLGHPRFFSLSTTTLLLLAPPLPPGHTSLPFHNFHSYMSPAAGLLTLTQAALLSLASFHLDTSSARNLASCNLQLRRALLGPAWESVCVETGFDLAALQTLSGVLPFIK